MRKLLILGAVAAVYRGPHLLRGGGVGVAGCAERRREARRLQRVESLEARSLSPWRRSDRGGHGGPLRDRRPAVAFPLQGQRGPVRDGTRATQPDGSVDLRQITANRAGRDVITVKAKNLASGETCLGKATATF